MKLIYFALLIFVFCGIMVSCQSDSNQKSGSDSKGNIEKTQSTDTPQKRFERLVGLWQRPDGGYVVEIKSVDSEGKLDAAYYNPKTINVSESRASIEEGYVKIFIELRDTGYPGATYTLIHDEANDKLVGIYYQPSMNQSFEVFFTRM